MDTSNIINLGIFGVTAIAALTAIWQAKDAKVARGDAIAAQKQAEAARDRASTLAMEANDAFVRQAEALEHSNQLAEAALPVPEVQWSVNPASGSRWLAVNVGNVPAVGSSIYGVGDEPGLVRSQEAGPRDVMPGDALIFLALSVDAVDPRYRIEWNEGDTKKFVERTIL